ncbi:penicillin-binding protein 2 [Streptomyces sp. NP160]|uniref:peptidoglycan D,D-transpeptidase FtsI family protein n=1 Tax=Streptomyces sp. NP160 TaxID=2586637 RepID=UPI0015D626E8|nr:penicillin-binding protein 2 [Streptomyces sp. NP160]
MFTGRLVQLQVTDAGPLAEEALGRRLAEDPVPAARGTITDRDGAVLAQDVERRDITADPKLFGGPTPREPHLLTAAEAAARLAPVLGRPEAELAELLAPRTGADGEQVRWTVLARGVTPAVRRQVQQLAIPGLSSTRQELRTYPAGTTAGNLVGYVSTDGEALAGVERALDDVLRGTDGRRVYEKGRNGQRIPLADSLDVAAVDGRDVRLTIDADLQFYAQRAATAQAAATRAAWVSVVAMTPDGQVLALAESGSIDPARPGATPEAQRHNRSLEDVFEPGSTGKVITAAAAVEQGLATPETQLVVPDSMVLPRRGGVVRDSHEHAPQKLTFAGVLAESSNVGTIMVGQQLTLQQRYDYLRAFGLGEEQLGLPGETRGILTTPEQWSTNSRDPYVVLFGQGYAVNALQAAQVYATIANGGVRVQPRIVAGTTDASGAFTPAPVPTGTRVVSERTAAQVTSMLEGVVSSEGTGMNAAVPGFRVAGKTGTAEDRAAGEGKYTASFIGMAPAEDPQVVVAVIVQHPDRAHHYGGVAAAPVFSDVMGFALAQQGVAPSGAPAQLPPLTWR